MKKNIIKTKNQLAWEATKDPYLIIKNLTKQDRETNKEVVPKISINADV